MSDEPVQEPGNEADIPREEWHAWCIRATESHAGRTLELTFVDDALGEVRLAEGKPLVAIEHTELGPSVAITVRYGDGVLPLSYVIAEPRELREIGSGSGEGLEVHIVDSTNRRTYVSLA